MDMLQADRRMSISATSGPGRKGGWWTYGFGLAVFLALARVLTVEDAPAGTFGRAWMLGTGFGALICGFLAGAFGLVAILRHRERAMIGYLALIPGLLAVYFFTEIVFPH